MRRSQALGKYGEEVAEEFLKQQGLEILDRNWRCDVGEIDIVARDGHVLVICEVKTRSSYQLGSPAEAITVRKLRRLRHLAFRWLLAHEAHVPEVRIDVICIVQPAWGAPEIEHLRSVGA